jgi:hypothetical protein
MLRKQSQNMNLTPPFQHLEGGELCIIHKLLHVHYNIRVWRCQWYGERERESVIAGGS